VLANRKADEVTLMNAADVDLLTLDITADRATERTFNSSVPFTRDLEHRAILVSPRADPRHDCLLFGYDAELLEPGCLSL
jgi:hypothetical protein